MPADRAPIALDAAHCSSLLPRRDRRSHKGSHGTVICVAGSLDYAGAAFMTGAAAVRGGAGLVSLAVPRSLQPIFAGRVPETITLGLPETDDGTVDPSSAAGLICDQEPAALVIGPGLQEGRAYELLTLELLAMTSAPAVVDAAAVNMLAGSGAWFTRVPPERCVLTPHPGEFGRLTGEPVGDADDERLERCAEAASRFGQCVVLKGANTVVADASGNTAVSPFENAALATAGSGDVLAGLIGALLAQGVDLFAAACLGVYLHGRAGERISERLGNAGLMATELPYEAAVARHELARLRDA